MTTSLRVLHATREHWTKELSNQTFETHALLKMIKEGGNLKFIPGGTKTTWSVKFKELDLNGVSDMEALAFARTTVTKKPELEWKGYKMTEAISEQEFAENGKGDTQIIDLFKSKTKEMEQDANSKLCREFYIDGNATGNEKRMSGIETFMSNVVSGSGQLVADQFATTLDDTYAGLATAKGTYGPSGERAYDFWSPTVVNATTTGETFATKAVEQLRRLISETRRTGHKDHRLNMIVANRANYRAIQDLMDAGDRRLLGPNSVAKFGFDDVLNFDGVDLVLDPDVPTTDGLGQTIRCYGFNTKQMELQILTLNGKKMLWNASGDTFREDNMAFRFWIGFYGQIKHESPRHFGAIKDLGGA